MNYIEFFKLQAKNLLRDYKTQEVYQDGEFEFFRYKPKYFDVEAIFGDFGNLRSIFADYYCDEADFKLGNAQHIIALLVGFNRWADLINAKESELELAKFLFDNQDKISVVEFNEAMEDYENNYGFDCRTDFKLEWLKDISKHSFSEFPVYSIPHLKKQREYILSKGDKGNNIVCLHCGNICPANGNFIHKMDCDSEDWDLMPTKEAVKIEI